ADPADCSLQFDPLGTAKFNSSCDIAKGFIARAGISYETVAAEPGAVAQVRIGERVLPAFAGEGLSADDLKTKKAAWERDALTMLQAARYPSKADPAEVNHPLVVLIIVVLMVYGAMVYGPIA